MEQANARTEMLGFGAACMHSHFLRLHCDADSICVAHLRNPLQHHFGGWYGKTHTHKHNKKKRKEREVWYSIFQATQDGGADIL